MGAGALNGYGGGYEESPAGLKRGGGWDRELKGVSYLIMYANGKWGGYGPGTHTGRGWRIQDYSLVGIAGRVIPAICHHIEYQLKDGGDGLTIKLIHRDSIESPLYPGNLTMEQRIVRLNQQSKTRLEQMALVAAMTRTAATPNQTIDPNGIIHVPVTLEGTFYLALVGIGTTKVEPEPYFESYYFIVDTGSSVTWIQCEGCNPCFYQKAPLFPYRKSTTCSESLCDSKGQCEFGICEDSKCTYTVEYVNAITKGDFGFEKFTFNSDDGGIEAFDHLRFGCGLKQSNFDFGLVDPMQNEIAGILGLGRGPTSFPNQLQLSDFSYCLRPWYHEGGVQEVSTFLRMGNDARFQDGQTVYTTPLDPRDSHYLVTLEGISFQGVRLPIEASAFARTPDGKGGCLLDTGSPWTVIQRKEYDIVKSAMRTYFLDFNVALIPLGQGLLDLCYINPNQQGIPYPSMTFHFQGADFEIGPNQLFLNLVDGFCLAVLPHDLDLFSVLIGNHMQTNRRFVYNTDLNSLAFAREDYKLAS
ncbi:hypothetical protein IFM89_016741 [Coptis chinensis]|uniref:Peptidase A1 domain-containing protein n=1 Tax=Coptis chinensis TaxID=261450 RepID=A0A835H4A9_9MAGN|nr:hypothetical protein IFM89_016741 [Coptis chinensis]